MIPIVFLGYAIDNIEASQLYGASIAGNKMQVSILKGLSRYQNLQVDSVTIYPQAAWPNGNIWIKNERIHVFGEFFSHKVSILNLPIFKQFMETIQTFFAARKLMKRNKSSVILTFNMFPQNGLPALLLKKLYKVRVISILADLPVDDNTDRKGISVWFRHIFDYITCKSIPHCDALVVLNEYAARKYAPDKEYLLVEGGIERENLTLLRPKHFLRKNIVYSGALSDYSGILNLIEAMDYVKDPEAILEIYGDGWKKEVVEKMAERVPNIVYCGKVENTAMKKIQEEAYLLVNPRPVKDPVSMVTFPSKIFEYLSSGTPVLTTHLNGFTKEYLEHMYVAENDSPEALGVSINNILRLSGEELQYKAKMARRFILENKTWETQCEKIYQFIRNII